MPLPILVSPPRAAEGRRGIGGDRESGTVDGQSAGHNVELGAGKAGDEAQVVRKRTQDAAVEIDLILALDSGARAQD